MFLILFVLHDPDQLKEILEAWDNAGAKGITIIPSTGLARLKNGNIFREDLPLIPSLEDLMQNEEHLNRTLFTIVQDDAEVDKIVEATQSVTGNLNNPNTGILAVLPMAKVYGFNRKNSLDEDIDD